MKVKKVYPNDFKTMFGVATMGMMSVGGAAFMTTMFMSYLTDYAGIGAMGATLATILLLVGRIVDAVDDPLQGWIMDSSRANKRGKYKRFVLLSIVMTTLSVILLYLLPASFATKPALVVIWVTFFYLAYDFGCSFYAATPLLQSLSDDETTRSKFFMWNRVIGIFIAIPMSFFLSSALMLNQQLNNMRDSIAIMTPIWLIPVGVIAFLGTSLIKEGRHVQNADHHEKISVHDIVAMLKKNKALQIHFFSSLFSGFMWTLIFATEVYYLKWAFCADLTTGVVDEMKLASYTLIVGMLQILPMLLAAFVSPVLTKKFGSSIKTMVFSLWFSIVPGLILFVLQLAGVLAGNFGLFVGLLAIQLFGVGLGFVPGNAVWLECIDYNAFKTGKEMGALVNSIKNFLEKAQAALATSIVGAVLIAIGYQVNSVTNDYAGDISAIPQMLNWFILVSGLIPSLLAVLSVVLYKFYPVTPAVRAEMKAALQARKDAVNPEKTDS